MNRAYWLRDGALTEGALEDFFPFLSDEGRHVIALVGAGGKTTLMYELARECCRRGYRTAVTTTTRILRPAHCPSCRTLEECQKRWANREYAVWGMERSDGKLGALAAGDFDSLAAEADVLLVEADGARRMACKVPAAHEPVIPAGADTVIGVLGMDALGKPLEAVCFRPEETAAVLNCGVGHRLTPEDLARILRSDAGTRKGVGGRAYYAVLNKCDDPARRSQGEQILRRLGERAALTCFAPEYRR